MSPVWATRTMLLPKTGMFPQRPEGQDTTPDLQSRCLLARDPAAAPNLRGYSLGGKNASQTILLLAYRCSPLLTGRNEMGFLT